MKRSWLDDAEAVASMPLLCENGLAHEDYADSELVCIIEQLWAEREGLT